MSVKVVMTREAPMIQTPTFRGIPYVPLVPRSMTLEAETPEQLDQMIAVAEVDGWWQQKRKKK